MPQTVNVPDVGEVDFPDSMSDDAIKVAVRGIIAKQKPKAAEDATSYLSRFALGGDNRFGAMTPHVATGPLQGSTVTPGKLLPDGQTESIGTPTQIPGQQNAGMTPWGSFPGDSTIQKAVKAAPGDVAGMAKGMWGRAQADAKPDIKRDLKQAAVFALAPGASFGLPTTPSQILPQGKAVLEHYGNEIMHPQQSIEEHPVGTLLDLSALLKGGSALTGSRPGLAAGLSTAANAVDPMAQAWNAVKALGTVSKKATDWGMPKAYGFLSHVGEDAPREIINNPNAVPYLRGQKTIQDARADVIKGTKSIKGTASDEYQQGMDALDAAGGTVNVTNPMINELMAALTDKRLAAKPVPKQITRGGKPSTTFSFPPPSPFANDTATTNAINRVWATLTEPGMNVNMTPRDAVGLIRGVANARKRGTSPTGQQAVNIVKSKGQEVMGQAYPEYPAMNERYSNAMSDVRDIRHAFGKGAESEGGNSMETIQKLATANKQNNSQRMDVLKMLRDRTGLDAPAAIAGYTMSPTFPKGLGGVGMRIGGAAGLSMGLLGHLRDWPAAAAVLLGSSPRLMGELANLQGMFGRGAPKAAGYVDDALRGGAYKTPAARSIIIKDDDQKKKAEK